MTSERMRVFTENEDEQGAVVDEATLGAIDALSAANRRGRNADVEMRLVQLRERAFAGHERCTHAERAADNLTRGQIASPREVRASELTADVLRRGILEHGSLVVRGLLDTHAVERLVFDIDRAFEGARAVANGASSDETSPWYVPFVPHNGPPLDAERRMVEATDALFAVDSPRTLFDLIAACDDAGLRDLVTTYLGERPVLTATKTTLRRARADSVPAWWHQDGSFLGRIGALNVWFALSHCGVDAPSLDVVNRRADAVWPTGTNGAHYPWSLGAELVENRAAGSIERLVFEPGDALLFDELLVHRTGASPEMPNVRYAIETWFFRQADAPLDRIPLLF